MANSQAERPDVLKMDIRGSFVTGSPTSESQTWTPKTVETSNDGQETEIAIFLTPVVLDTNVEKPVLRITVSNRIFRILTLFETTFIFVRMVKLTGIVTV